MRRRRRRRWRRGKMRVHAVGGKEDKRGMPERREEHVNEYLCFHGECIILEK
jgi:hypothetical protein